MPGLEAGQLVEFLGKQSLVALLFVLTVLVTGIFESGVVAGQWNTMGNALVGNNVITIGVASPNTDIYAFRVEAHM